VTGGTVTHEEAKLAVAKAGILGGAFENYAKRMQEGKDEIPTRAEMVEIYSNLSKLFDEMGWTLATALDGDLK